eukprot:1920740-Heterocapsa_arctica.AAC.1
MLAVLLTLALKGFIKHNEAVFLHDTEAQDKHHQNLMVGLMADDIEASAGFDPKALRTDNELLENETFKECVALRYLQFFNSRNPTDEQ